MQERVYLAPNIGIALRKSPDGKEEYFHISMEKILKDLDGRELELLKFYTNLDEKGMTHLVERLSSKLKEFQETSENIVKLNEFITLKLEHGHSNIYVKDKIFTQCKYLLFNIPVDELKEYDEIQSIDEAEKILNDSMHGKHAKEFNIDPKEEFRAHCSNLQAWVENNYNTQILHRNIAFPLLRALVKAGDPQAKNNFKNELAYRLESNDIIVTKYLIMNNYLDDLSNDELAMVIENMKPGIGKIVLMEYYNKEREKTFVQVGNIVFNDKKMALHLNNKEIYITALDKNSFPYSDYKKAFNLQLIERYSRYLLNGIFYDFGITHGTQKVVFRTEDITLIRSFFNNNDLIMVQIPRSRAPLKLSVESENTAIYIYPELLY